MQKPSRLSLLALVASVALMITACSDDSDDSASSASTTAAAGAATTAASGPTSTLDPIVGNVDLGPLAGCPFFTKADAEAFLGVEVSDPNLSGSQVDGDTILAVCAYNDTSGVPQNGVSVSAKLVPGSGSNLQGDLVDLEQNQLAGLALEPVEGLGDAARSAVFPGSEIKLVVVFTGEYQVDVAAGPNQSMEDVIELARDTIPKLPPPSD
jgi:hypothetical protein